MTPTDSDLKVHIDVAGGRRRFEVAVRSESVFDAVLAVWSAFGGNPEAAAHEVGIAWFDEFRDSVPEAVRMEMGEMGLLDGPPWGVLLAFLAASAPSGSDDAVLEWLERVPDVAAALVRQFAAGAAAEDLAAVVERRDPDALARILPTVKEHVRPCIQRTLALPPDLAGARLAAVLRTILHDAYAPRAGGWSHAIALSAETTRHLAVSLQPTELIERITNGLDFDIPLGVTRLVAVPSVTLRPWTLITEYDDAVVVSYPVADEDMGTDPDVAPGWLVRYHKALGDEKRLRILREVSKGTTGLNDLTEVLGLAKSTVFHHIGILRAAGLLRVRLSGGDDGFRGYELRSAAFADADGATLRYLALEGPDGGDRS